MFLRKIHPHTDFSSADAKKAARFSGFVETFPERQRHLLLWENQRRGKSEARRFCIHAHPKAGEPPVSGTDFIKRFLCRVQTAADSREFCIRYRFKMRRVIGVRRNHALRMVNSDLSAGVDPVLSLPEFHQPGSSLIIKVHGKCVNHHPGTHRHGIIFRLISLVTLPGIQP